MAYFGARLGAGVIYGALALSCSSNDSNGSSSSPSTTNVVTMQNFGETHTSVATYYTTADGSGACLFDKDTSDTQIAALDSSVWANSAWCGACVDITGPMGNTIRVRIVDECPTCVTDQLDLHPGAFSELAPMSEGRIPITWTFVACDVTGPVQYKYKDGSNAYWTAVQVRNSRYPISKFESSQDGSTWVEAARQDYNYFLNDKGFGTGMAHVRITAESGEVLEDTLPAVQENAITAGAAQFQ